MSMYPGKLPTKAAVVDPSIPVCIHYWMIDNQSVGRCKKCLAVKDFGKLREELSRHYSKGNRKNPPAAESG